MNKCLVQAACRPQVQPSACKEGQGRCCARAPEACELRHCCLPASCHAWLVNTPSVVDAFHGWCCYGATHNRPHLHEHAPDRCIVGLLHAVMRSRQPQGVNDTAMRPRLACQATAQRHEQAAHHLATHVEIVLAGRMDVVVLQHYCSGHHGQLTERSAVPHANCNRKYGGMGFVRPCCSHQCETREALCMNLALSQRLTIALRGMVVLHAHRRPLGLGGLPCSVAAGSFSAASVGTQIPASIQSYPSMKAPSATSAPAAAPGYSVARHHHTSSMVCAASRASTSISSKDDGLRFVYEHPGRRLRLKRAVGKPTDVAPRVDVMLDGSLSDWHE